MKLTFVYGSWACGPRPFDFTRIYHDPRGLTGSEISFLSFAKELAFRGHSVRIFAPLVSCPAEGHLWDGIRVFPISMWTDDRGEGSDFVLSWNEPDQLRYASLKAIRIINQQLNDFTYCKPGFESFVDIFTSPCSAHLAHMTQVYGSAHKWTVLPNGCDPTVYPTMDRIPGRILYASSPDRGLHWLLQQWPLIKRRVPDATLRVFYNFDDWANNLLGCDGQGHHPHIRECAYRAYYIREAFVRLKNQGVEHFKSISRVRMAEEMASAIVLAYPCDTVTYTEGFSATLMEACAAGLIPVTAKVDSLGCVYGDWVETMVESPVREHLNEWTEMVIRSLTDEDYRKRITAKSRALAEQHSWSKLTDRLEQIFQTALIRRQS